MSETIAAAGEVPAVQRRRGATRRAPWEGMFAVVGVAGPCLYLALHRGGTLNPSLAVAYGWVFLALFGWMTLEWRAGRAVTAPWTIPALLAWPLAQVIPLPRVALEWLSPERARELGEFAAAGVTPPATLSIYPYATLRTLLVLAGTAALYLLTRELGRRHSSAIYWLSAAVLALALAEAAPAARQYLLTHAGLGVDDPRGTFGNRNVLAAWLAGCYGVALGLAAGPVRTWVWPARGVALGSAAVIILTFSRMGILSLGVATAVFATGQWSRSRRARATVVAVGLLLAFLAAAVGLSALAKRYRPSTLEQEKQGRLAMWPDAIRAARRYPLTGAGAGTFPYAFRRTHPYLAAYTIDHPHNDYLETVVEWGMPAGMLLGAGVLVALGRRRRELAGAPAELRALGWGSLAGAAALALHSLVDFPLRIPAVLGLFGVLLGLAAAVTPAREPPRRSRWISAVVASATLGLAGGSFALPQLERGNVEELYQVARQALDAGLDREAEQACRRALAANPYAAPLWTELAFLAEQRKEPATAEAYIELAEKLEPHTQRGHWRAANLYLRLGATDRAMERLAALAAHAAPLRTAVWEAAWGAEVDPERIRRELGTPARDEYINYLLGRGRWEAAAEAAGSGAQPETLRAVFDRLFLEERAGAAQRLWERLGGRDGFANTLPVGAALPATGWARLRGRDGFANPELAAPLRGWGLDWVVFAAAGVQVERRADPEGHRLEVWFERPQNLFYGGVVHDFLAAPGKAHRLRLEAAGVDIASSTGVFVEVLSARRQLAVSEPFLRSTGWRTVELRFTPGPGERLCRLRVMRPRSDRFDNQVSGRFSLRRVSLAVPD